jgi:DNA-binding LytR/AlgR family response regulator
MNLKCIIVDDEPVARKGLEEYVNDTGFLQLVGKCENAIKAMTLLNEKNVDLIFLDIQMPKLSGIDFLKSLREPPMVIFTTAYPEYALESYELDVIDYLVKPITFERFVKAAQKALDYKSLRENVTKGSTSDFFFVKCDHKYEKINYVDVLYIEAMQNYSIIHTGSKKLIAYITFSGIESKLPSDQFLKVHKSYIVHIPKINAVEGNEILIGSARIPISRNLKEEVMKRVVEGNLFKR